MKYIIPGMLCMLLALSCTRTNQQTTPVQNATTAVLDSSFFYSTGPGEIVFVTTKFHYDDQGRFTGTYTTMTDSTTDHIAVSPDTTTLALTYNETDSIPSGYTFTNPLEPYPFGAPGPSRLSYDNQGRILVDSTQNATYSTHFAYGVGYISWVSHYTSGDTVFFDNNDNAIRYFDQYEGTDTYNYSDYPNPYYLPQLASHTGIAFFHNYLNTDMISKNLFSKVVHGGYSKTYNYTWTLNTDGQVVSGIGTDQDTGQPAEYYRFVYKK